MATPASLLKEERVEKFSASVAKRHIGCTGSANLELSIPNWVAPERDPDADNAANRGTIMHEIFANVMALPVKDQVHMAEAISYVAAIRATRRFKSLIETPMKAMWLKSTPSTTADLVLYVADELHVFDFKTGKIPVDPWENEQLMYYAVTYAPLAMKAKGAHLHIVQPSAGITTGWFASAQRLHQFAEDAKAAEAAILAGNTDLVPGDHCLFCPANPHSRGAKGRPFCPAMMSMLYPGVGINEKEMLGGLD